MTRQEEQFDDKIVAKAVSEAKAAARGEASEAEVYRDSPCLSREGLVGRAAT